MEDKGKMKIGNPFSHSEHCPGRGTRQYRVRTLLLVCLICGALLFLITPSTAKAQEDVKAAPKTQSGGDLGAVGAKLANPLSSLWSLVMNFEVPKFFDGNLNTGDPEVGANMIFQPVLPIPLYGTGKAQWRLITRPVIPFIFSQPSPEGLSSPAKGTRGPIQVWRVV